MVFYTGDVFPAWRGSALVGGLTLHGLVRLEMQGTTVTGEDRIPLGDRIRDVEQGPDGLIYVLTDRPDGHVLRIAPLR
jgi:glucose/arabinose dehydrogenase